MNLSQRYKQGNALCAFSGNDSTRINSQNPSDPQKAKHVRMCIRPLWQGFSNGCGTTSLAMVLNTLAAKKGNSHRFTREMLDYRRPFNTYTAPGTLVKLAKEQGYYAGQYQQATFQDIKEHLNAGRLVIALHNPTPDALFSALHYAVIHGYEDGLNPSHQKLMIMDPMYAHPDDASQKISYNNFYKKWSDIKEGHLPIGVDRFMVVISDEDFQLPSRRIPLAIMIANGWLDIINWYANSWLAPIGKAGYRAAKRLSKRFFKLPAFFQQGVNYLSA